MYVRRKIKSLISRLTEAVEGRNEHYRQREAADKLSISPKSSNTQFHLQNGTAPLALPKD
jgi:hypothetical protein